MTDRDPFAPHMEAVARALLGEPNKHLSNLTELRWGSYGSLSVDLVKGVWSDHENGVGGGVLALLDREKRLTGAQAFEYLRNDLGLDIPDDRQQRAAPVANRKIVATYDYLSEDGEVLFQVVRFDPKDFRQRRPDGSGWSWSVKGVRQVPYRLPEIIEAMAMGRTVYVVEGEKDVDRLWSLGIPATCNAGGAGKWPEGMAQHFKDATVCILPDNDEAGRNHAGVVGAALSPVASVRILALPGLALKGDVSDWLQAGGTADQLAALTATAQPWRPAPPESRFGAKTWDKVDASSFRQDWLIEDLIFQGDTALIYGAKSSGKSFLMMDMALAIARGSEFLGKAASRGAVLYQAGEGGVGLEKRMIAYRMAHDIDESLPFVLLPARVNLFEREGDRATFLEEVAAWSAYYGGLKAVVIDTLATAMGGADENTSEGMGTMIAAGDAIKAVAPGAALFWVHHKNAAGERERGHSSLGASVDTALEVTREENSKTRTMKLTKLKDGEDGITVQFELQSVEIGAYDNGKPITSCVVSPVEDGEPQTGQRLFLPTGQYKFLKTLDDAITQRGGIVPAGDNVPTNMPGVAWVEMRAIYSSINGHMDANAIKQALHRDGDKLMNLGIINRWENWIWITDKGRHWLAGERSVTHHMRRA